MVKIESSQTGAEQPSSNLVVPGPRIVDTLKVAQCSVTGMMNSLSHPVATGIMFGDNVPNPCQMPRWIRKNLQVLKRGCHLEMSKNRPVRLNLIPLDTGKVQQEIPVDELAQFRRRTSLQNDDNVHVRCRRHGGPVREGRY